MKITDKEVDIILKALPSYWKNRGEKKILEDAYRYFLKHGELQEKEDWNIAYNYVVERIVHVLSEKISSNEEFEIRRFIKQFYNTQVLIAPEIAEQGKEAAEYLMLLFKGKSELVDKLLSYQKEHS